MQPDLTRIKPFLRKLKTISTIAPEDVAGSRPQRNGYSFEIAIPTPQRRNSSQQHRPDADVDKSTKHTTYKEPELPNFNSPSQKRDGRYAQSAYFVNAFAEHGRLRSMVEEQRAYRQRHHASADLETTLPQPEICTDFATCQAQLQQILGQIQTIYNEGPLVDGYLESFPDTSQQTVTLSQDQVDVESAKDIYNFGSGKVSWESPSSVYHLCGVDATGKKWSYPCPLEQLPSVSIAIARFQKLQQLLKRKHHIETRLKQMSESPQPEI